MHGSFASRLVATVEARGRQNGDEIIGARRACIGARARAQKVEGEKVKTVASEIAVADDANIIMEIDPDRNAVWFRLYANDAAVLREKLVPGKAVSINAVVSTYEASGGHTLGEVDVDMSDRFQIHLGSLELVVWQDEDGDEKEAS